MKLRADLGTTRASLLVIAILTTTAAQAQTSPSAVTSSPATADEPGESDIVVTAQFRKQNLQDTPVSITAVNAAMLESRGQTSLTEIAQSVPSLSLKPFTFGSAITAFIRGVGQSDINASVEPGVGIYVDDVNYATLVGSQIDLLDLDRVEVLRGPQGTLAGRNSIGGAIKLYTRKPGPDSDAFLSVGYGTRQRIEVRGGTNFTLANDTLYGRISGVYKSQNGYVTRYDYRCTHPTTTTSAYPSYTSGQSCVLGREGGYNDGGIRGQLRWTPVSGLEVNLSGDYTRNRDEPVANTLLAAFTTRGGGVGPVAGGINFVNPLVTPVVPGTPLPGSSPYISSSPIPGITASDPFSNSPYINYSAYSDPFGKPAGFFSAGSTAYSPYSVVPQNNLDIWGFSGTIDYEISDKLSIKSITAYRSYNTEAAFNQSVSPLKTSLSNNIYNNWQFSQELRLSGKIGDTVDFTVGGLYAKQKTTLGGRLNAGAFDTVNLDLVPASSKAAFAHVDWEAVPNLHLIGGIRYTSETKNYIFNRRAANGDPISTVPSVASFASLTPQEYSGSHTDFRLGLQYRWSSNFMTYAQFASGFKGGGVNPRPFSVAQVQPFRIEEIKAYEVGFKSDFFDRRVRLNGAVFQSDYSDIQITVLSCPTFSPGPCAAPINAGAARLRGGELEATIEPIDGFKIDASGSILDFKYKSLTAEALASGITLASRPPFLIEKQFAVGAQYEASLGKAGFLTPRIDLSYQSGFYAGSANDIYNYVNGYTLMNARLSWRNSARDLEVALSVSNLTDKLYYNTVFDNRGSSQTIVGAPAAPRQWFLSLKKMF